MLMRAAIILTGLLDATAAFLIVPTRTTAARMGLFDFMGGRGGDTPEEQEQPRGL